MDWIQSLKGKSRKRKRWRPKSRFRRTQRGYLSTRHLSIDPLLGFKIRAKLFPYGVTDPNQKPLQGDLSFFCNCSNAWSFKFSAWDYVARLFSSFRNVSKFVLMVTQSFAFTSLFPSHSNRIWNNSATLNNCAYPDSFFLFLLNPPWVSSSVMDLMFVSQNSYVETIPSHVMY